jgi:hypothetical protein
VSPILVMLVAGLAAIWLVVQVARTAGAGWAILTFFFSPAAGLLLVRDWDDAKSIAPAYLVAMATLALYLFVAIPQMRDAMGDAALMAGQGDGVHQLIDGDDPEADAMRLRQALGRVQFQRGEISIPAAHATLAIPRHFKLVPRASIEMLAADLDGTPPAPHVFGWLVHETVDLADEDSWLVEVAYVPIGHVAEGDADELDDPALAEANRLATEGYAEGEYAFDSFLRAPAWREDIGTLAWGEWLEYADEPDKLLDCYAVKPTREGVIMFLAEYMPAARAELCERSVRLLAASTRFDRDWDYRDYSFWRDDRSGSGLADLVTGAAFE